jgi:hypothetical protein
LPPSDGWLHIFNGKDLNGWTPLPEPTSNWKVENGILIGRGPPSHLFTEKADFENLHVRVHAKINAAGNSGVHFRADLTVDKKFFAPHGYEAQIGGIADPYKTGSLFKFPSEEWLIHSVPKQVAPINTWFTMEVIANGNHLQVKVNDEVVTDAMDDSFSQGHLALQVYSSGTIVQFKSVEVKQLPPKDSCTPCR